MMSGYNSFSPSSTKRGNGAMMQNKKTNVRGDPGMGPGGWGVELMDGECARENNQYMPAAAQLVDM